MFGRKFKRSILVGFILIAFCIYIIKLYIQNDIGLYIHPRYMIFSLVMSVMAVIFLALGIYIEARKHPVVKPAASRIRPLDIVVVTVLVLAFILPAQALSSKAIGRKSVNTPSYETQPKRLSSNANCPTTKPTSIEIWIYEISQYPLSCYSGQSIELTGFVFETPESPLPANMYYLGRVVMSCCVIDARPYALPVKQGGFEHYPKETWLKVSGTLKEADIHGTIQLVIEPDNVVKVSNPSQPYDYINTPSRIEVQPIQP